MSEHPANRALSAARAEERDVPFRLVLALLALIGTVAVALAGLAYAIFPGEVQDRRFTGPFPNFPLPQLQPDPQADMAAFRKREADALNSAGWLDRRVGTVHVPIDQAMRAVAAEGIAGWPTGKPR